MSNNGIQQGSHIKSFHVDSWDVKQSRSELLNFETHEFFHSIPLGSLLCSRQWGSFAARDHLQHCTVPI